MICEIGNNRIANPDDGILRMANPQGRVQGTLLELERNINYQYKFYVCSTLYI
jgi:hypothetical protein